MRNRINIVNREFLTEAKSEVVEIFGHNAIPHPSGEIEFNPNTIINECIDLLSEIAIIGSLAQDDSQTLAYFKNAVVVDTLSGNDISFVQVDNQHAFLLGTIENPLAHLIVQDNNGYYWSMELRSYVSGQGYGAALLIWATKVRFKQLFLDPQMTIQSVGMIEKLISSGKLTASIVDRVSGTMSHYNPNADFDIPMYNQVYDKRPALTRPAEEIVWMIESELPRRGLLNKYVKYGPKLSGG